MPIFVDFEASGLHACSYPIEVGWADERGASGSILIRPELNWQYWSEESEKIHGISREQLDEEGVSALEAVNWLIDAVHGETVIYCDSPLWDSFWLLRLVEAGGKRVPLMVQNAVALIQQTAMEYGKLPELSSYYRMANALPLRQHRAADDAARLAALYAMVVSSDRTTE